MLSQIIRRRPWTTFGTTAVGTFVGAAAAIELFSDYQEEYAGTFLSNFLFCSVICYKYRDSENTYTYQPLDSFSSILL